MSISELSASLKNAANTQLIKATEKELDELVKGTLKRFDSKIDINKAASILTNGKYTYLDKKGQQKEYALSEAFREAGSTQGRTAFVVTDADINILFKTLNISAPDNLRPFDVYLSYLFDMSGKKYKASHYELYSETAETGPLVPLNKRKTLKEATLGLDKASINAIRGTNFSHSNTFEHIADFLKFSIPEYSKKSTNEIVSIITQFFDRGHIYAQTTGRVLASIQEIEGEKSFIKQISKLSELLDEVSSGLTDSKVGVALLAAAKKDFTDSKLRMNIGLQLKISGGLGNAETAKLSNTLRIVGLLQSFIDNKTLNTKGTRRSNNVARISISIFIKELDKFIKKLSDTQNEAINNMHAVLKQSSDPNYLLNLITSKSIKQYLAESVVDSLKGISNKPLKVNHKDIPVKRSNIRMPNVSKVSTKIKAELAAEVRKLDKLIQEAKKDKKIKLRTTGGQFISPVSIKNILNSRLAQQIQNNMGKGSAKAVLNYRTGRFAESAQVTNVSNRDNAIIAFYSYMKNPYATFAPGGAQSSPASRDPNKLIQLSIRQLATGIMANRLKVVPV